MSQPKHARIGLLADKEERSAYLAPACRYFTPGSSFMLVWRLQCGLATNRAKKLRARNAPFFCPRIPPNARRQHRCSSTMGLRRLAALGPIFRETEQQGAKIC